MNLICSFSQSKKWSAPFEENDVMIKEFYSSKEKDESQFNDLLSKVVNSISDNRRLTTSSLYDIEMKKIEEEIKNKKNMFELNWSEQVKGLEESLRYSRFKIVCRKLFNKVDDFLHSLYSQDEKESYDKIKGNLSKLLAELKEEYSCGVQLRVAVPSHDKEINFLLEDIEALNNKLDSAKQSLLEEEKFDSQIKCLSDQCQQILKETNYELNTWKSKITNYSLNQSHKESLKETNNLLEDIFNFKKSTLQQSDLLSRDINEKLNQKVGMKRSGTLKDLEYSLLENLKTVDSLISKIEMVRTNIQHKISESELEQQLKAEAERMIRLAKEKEAYKKKKVEVCQDTQTYEEAPIKPPTPEMEVRSVAPIFSKGLDDLVILEGKWCCFYAEVSGIPEPRITWFKDGIPVENNSDYISKHEKGTCTLVIEESMKEDSANWSVRAANSAGYAETHAKLTVKEVKPVEQEFAPYIKEKLENCSIKEGECLELKCTVSGRPIPTTSWYKNGVCIDKSKYYNIGGEDDLCILKIEKTYLEDASEFTCKIINRHGQASTSAKVNVIPIQPIIAPKFQNPLANVVVKAGDEISMECVITGTPPPVITWFKDNRALQSSSEMEIVQDGNVAKLKIRESYPKTAGTYICKGQNVAGEALTTSTVYFKAITPPFSDSETSEDLKAQKPAFYVPLCNAHVKEHSILSLECSIVGQPNPEVSWFKDNSPIRSSKLCEFLQEGAVHKMIIKDAETSHSGLYSVKAKNNLGESKSSCVVNIQASLVNTECQTDEEAPLLKKTNTYTHSVTKKSTSKTTLTTQADKFMEPRFTNPIQGQIIEEGSSLILLGTFTGRPLPQISWTRNNKVLESIGNIKVVSSKNRSQLVVEKANEAASGKYICKAENEAGVAESIADVVVKKKNIPPVFIKRLQSKYLEIGQRLILEVEIGGAPFPEIVWYFNEKEISPSQDIHIRRLGCHATLIIDMVSLKNNGQYAVKAVNEAGEATCVANVVVEKETTPPPRPPDPVSDSGRDTRDNTPTSRSTTSGRDLGPETQALRTLAAFKRNSRPLPDLLPFPFKPDEPISRQKKNNTKVPKPSKFTKGEMYYSDYESDFESNIGVKWRGTQSDTEDTEFFYKKVRPVLSKGFSQQTLERKPSPPCPHQWESHEDIDRLENEIRKRKLLFLLG